MNILKAFFLAVCVLFSGAISAASTVSVKVVPGEFVGLTSAGYWAGIYVLDVNGTKMLAMDDVSPWYGLTSSPPWYTDGSTWTANLYTQDDIIAGATVLSTNNPAAYSKAAQFFAPGLLGYGTLWSGQGADPLWAAGFDDMIMNTTTVLMLQKWSYAKQIYDTSTGTTLYDVYNSMLPTLDSNYDYRGKMMVLSNIGSNDPRVAEFLVFAAPVPIPPAVWLFASGLLGLVGVARRKRT